MLNMSEINYFLPGSGDRSTEIIVAAKYTTLSRAFTGRLGRGITSRIAKDLVNKENGFLPFPLQTQFMSHLRTAAIEQEKWDMILFWGGQIAPLLKHTKAAELMNSVLEETAACFDHNF